jgi:Ca2+-binding RTX toxin-like protein
MRSFGRSLVAAAVLVVAAVGLAAPASAVTCTFTAPTVTIAVIAGETVTIARNGDAIAVNGAACGAATVSTTDSVVVTATGTPTEIAIDETGGRFEPGAAAEADGDSEIEFTVTLPTGSPRLRVIGTAEADSFAVGTGGINLNADEATGDVDVTISGTPAISLEGAGGDDVLSVAGGAGTGVAGPGAAVPGGAGDDYFLAGVGGSAFDGGDGADTVDFTAVTGGVAVDLHAGTAEGQGSDTLAAVENVTGSPGDDEIAGDDLANVLAGGDGNDTIDGEGEADTLLGGAGTDIVSFASATKGVTVDLKKGTAKGDGADTLDGFENVEGTRKADVIHGSGGKNTLDGADGPDTISGGNGADQVLGGDGNDLLFGEKGNDVLKGGDGKDQLDGGDGNDRCNGGNDPDAFVFCEHL